MSWSWRPLPVCVSIIIDGGLSLSIEIVFKFGIEMTPPLLSTVNGVKMIFSLTIILSLVLYPVPDDNMVIDSEKPNTLLTVS